MRKITFLITMLLVAALSFGQVSLTPIWEFSSQNENITSVVDDVKNGFDISPDGSKLYLSTRLASPNQVAVYDAATGVRSGHLPGLTGFASTYGGDVAVDDNGAIYACNVIISASALTVAKWDNETATPVTFITTTAHTGSNANRIGYGMDVKINSSGNGFIIMHKNGTADFLVWTIVANVPVSQDPTIVTATGTTITEAYARISIVDDTHFWVDGNAGLPLYCTITLGEENPPAITAQRIATRTDINVGVGGAAEFTLAGKRYGVFAVNNHGTATGYQPKHHVLLQELQASGVGVNGAVLHKFPNLGLGGITDASHFVEVITYVSGSTAYIYLMGGLNGIAAFKVQPAKTFSVTVPQGTEKVYITGSFTDKLWDITAPFELAATANPNEFSGTFPCADVVEYKYLCGKGDWDYQEASSLGSTAWNPTDKVKPTGGSNRTYNASDVVTYWVAQPGVKLNVNFAEGSTVPSKLFVKGSWDNWTTPIELTSATSPKFSGMIGNGTTDLIYSNIAYKYYTTDEADPNWEANADGNDINDRWSIYPSMNDEIARFKTQLSTGIDQPTMDVKVLLTPSGISVRFDGDADIELYSISGQLIEKTRAYNNYDRDLQSGIYIIRVNGNSQKFVR